MMMMERQRGESNEDTARTGPWVAESANGTQAQHMKKETQSSIRLPWGVEAFIRIALLLGTWSLCVQKNAPTPHGKPHVVCRISRLQRQTMHQLFYSCASDRSGDHRQDHSSFLFHHKINGTVMGAGSRQQLWRSELDASWISSCLQSTHSFLLNSTPPGLPCGKIQATPRSSQPPKYPWQTAIDGADGHLKDTLILARTGKRNVLLAIRKVVQEKREQAVWKSWRYNAPENEAIIVSDLLEKILSWIDVLRESCISIPKEYRSEWHLLWSPFWFLL